MEDMHEIVVKYNQLTSERRELELKIKELRQKILDEIKKSGQDEIEFEDVKVVREVRKSFIITKEIKEQYGTPRDVDYLFVTAK